MYLCTCIHSMFPNHVRCLMVRSYSLWIAIQMRLWPRNGKAKPTSISKVRRMRNEGIGMNSRRLLGKNVRVRRLVFPLFSRGYLIYYPVFCLLVFLYFVLVDRLTVQGKIMICTMHKKFCGFLMLY